jgi:hypothetical protein
MLIHCWSTRSFDQKCDGLKIRINNENGMVNQGKIDEDEW